MYYPKQIPYLLDEKFKKNIDYIEYSIRELDDYCMCIWQMKSKEELNQMTSNNILPDACVDIVVDFATHMICFAGFSKETEPFRLQGKIDYMGVRFRPGAFYSLFHIESYQIMDAMVPFSKIEEKYNLDAIFSITNSQKRIDYLKNYLLMKIEERPNRFFMKVVDELYENPREQSVLNIAKRLGYNERQLYRIFMIHYGISPKVLLNILRLHLCLNLLFLKKFSLIEVALQCGFYDQAHFIKAIKRYTGISPLKLLEQYIH